VVELSAWLNGLKRVACSSGEMAMPVSSMSNRILACVSVWLSMLTRTETSPFALNLTALPIKFIGICFNRPGSPRNLA
jgi:hypothetical protein